MMTRNNLIRRVATLAAAFLLVGAHTSFADTNQVSYRTIEIDGQTIFYREAGSPDAPTLLLLHGFPTSSHMFRELIPALADRYHLVAPDYPGYGNSSMPSVNEFEYTFDRLSQIVDQLIVKLGIEQYSLYLNGLWSSSGLSHRRGASRAN